MKNIQFLLGAGASAFAQDPDCSPPLGDNLFAVLAQKYPGWRSLPDDARAEFEKTDGGFEHAMAMVHEKYEDLSAQLLCEMALFFLSFKAQQSCDYHRLMKWATSIKNTESYFSTLNYDTLLEQCFEAQGIGGGPLKLHGCPTFAPDLGTNVIKHASIFGNNRVQAPIKQLSREEAKEHWNQQIADKVFAPAMALYAPEKPVLYCPDKIKEIQSRWVTQLSSAQRIFVVGMRCTVEDLHIWGPLSQVDARLAFVNPNERDQAIFADWASRERNGKISEAAIINFSQFLDILEKDRIGDALNRI